MYKKILVSDLIAEGQPLSDGVETGNRLPSDRLQRTARRVYPRPARAGHHPFPSAGGQFGIGPAAAIKNLILEDAYVYQV